MRRALLFLLVGCPSQTPPQTDHEVPTVSAPPVASMSAAPSASVVMPAPAATADWRAAAPCSADADCDWDHPCVPHRCGAPRADKSHPACEESAPPPGACLCVEGACTLKPKSLPPPTGSCEVRGCEVDRGGGTCVADTGGVAEGLRTNRHVDVGPSCDCIEPSKGCVYRWYEPIPCKSESDCWVANDPRPHPIPRPRNIQHAFKPCSDGEIPPVCSAAGFCALGRGFSC